MLKEIVIEAIISTGEMRVISEKIIPGELEVTPSYCRKILDRIAKDKEKVGEREDKKLEFCADLKVREQKDRKV